MKNWVVFLLGLIIGVILTLVTLSITSKDDGLTFFDEPGESLSTGAFEIYQVLEEGAALAQEIDNEFSSYNTHTKLFVLLINDEGKLYYDDEIVKVPKGKCARQVGIYRYKTVSKELKTIPIVIITE